MPGIQPNIASRWNRRARSLKRKRLGAYTVEFAVCSGLFFFITLASIEFSRFMFARHSVDQAAYEAARVGIIRGCSPAQVRERAEQILGATGIRSAEVVVTPSLFDSNTRAVTVSIRAPFSESSWLRPLFFAASDLASSITLDHENQAYLTDSNIIEIGDNDNEPIDF
jgi:hypothetical protein